MGLFGGMRREGGASYGTVPGNGGPRADDKDMNVGPGHVVPAQNTHLAKQVVEKLGYDPNVKVDMNQGNGQGADIKISSKEFFLNDEQVNRMKNELGLDPEILSPDSEYNERVEGGSTQDAKEMIQQKLKSGGGIWSKMNKNQLQINNNNQYPAYQDAGSTDPVQPIQWETPGTLYPEMNASGKRPEGSGIQFRPLENVDNDAIPALADRQPIGFDGQPMQPTAKGPQGNTQQGFAQQGTTLPGLQEDGTVLSEDQMNMSPEEQYLQEMRDKNKYNANAEKATNVGMSLWNASRSRNKSPGPTLAPMREIVRDYEGMKLQGKKDIEASARGNMKKMRELGLTTQMVGADANTKAATNKLNSSIWNMQNQDSMMNAKYDNQRQANFYNKMDNFNMQDARDANTFAEKKGQNIANNAAQYFDVNDKELENESKLGGYQLNEKLDRYDAEYNKLDVAAIRATRRDFVSREQYYKMSPKEQAELRALKS